MKLITRQSRANEILERWDIWGNHNPDKVAARKQLEALGDIKDPDEVDRIIGNKSWTSVPLCSECDANGLDYVIEVGEVEDYESATARLCGKCLGKLFKLWEEIK